MTKAYSNPRSHLRRLLSAIGVLSAVLAIAVFLTGIENARLAWKAVVALVWRQHTHGAAGDELYDKFIRITIPRAIKGSMLAGQPYDVGYIMENLTSEELAIGTIDTTRYNRHYHQDGMPIYQLTELTSMILKPNQKIDGVFQGNAILPESIVIKIHHNLANSPSTFSCDLRAEYLGPLPKLRLSEHAIQEGYDGAIALQQAVRQAKQGREGIYFFSMFPSEATVVLDRESTLKRYIVKRWHITLVDSANRLLFFDVGDGSVIESGRSDSHIPLRPVPIPTVGNQRALSIATENGWTCGNWDDFKLLGGKMDGRWTCVWLLPYRDQKSEIVMIEANKGIRVTMSIEKGAGLLDDLPVFTTHLSSSAGQERLSERGTIMVTPETWSIDSSSSPPGPVSPQYDLTVSLTVANHGSSAFVFDAVLTRFRSDTTVVSEVTRTVSSSRDAEGVVLPMLRWSREGVGQNGIRCTVPRKAKALLSVASVDADPAILRGQRSVEVTFLLDGRPIAEPYKIVIPSEEPHGRFKGQDN
jgi:hypothetical protein